MFWAFLSAFSVFAALMPGKNPVPWLDAVDFAMAVFCGLMCIREAISQRFWI